MGIVREDWMAKPRNLSQTTDATRHFGRHLGMRGLEPAILPR